MDSTPSPNPGRQAGFDQVLSAAQSGDRVAREELFSRYYPQVERIVHDKLSRDLRQGRPWLVARFSTGDVVQEVFRGLLLDLSGFKGETEEAFIGYLAMMARNRLIDAIRFHEASQRDGRSTFPELDGLGEGRDQGPATQAASNDDAALLKELMEGLSHEEQLLLRARLEEETPFQELANQLGFSSASAARRAFYSAQAKLAIRLRERSQDGDAPS